jgi:ornithine cyclodeaminase
VVLHDGSTGRLVAVLNASPVTEIRTAAVSGVATRALARPGSRRVAIVGAGVQARAHVASMRAVLDEPEIRLWARRPEAAAALASEVGAATSPSLEEALADADVVCTTTTAREPIVERRLLPPGIHVNAVGWTPGGRELDTDTVAGSTLFVDRRESTLNESGNYLLAAAEGAVGPDGIAAEVGEVLVGAHPGRRSDDEVTLFISMGIAVEDLAAAELVVRRALERGAGTEVAF